MLNNNSANKYKTPYKVSFVITWWFTNATVNIQYILIKIRHNICRINPYKYDTNVEDINPNIMCEYINILSPVIYISIISKLVQKVYNWSAHEDLEVNSHWSCT